MKFKKIFIYSAFILQLSVITTPTPAIAQPNDSPVLTAEQSISPMADTIDWQYKFIDGVLYRRLYNFSTNTPLSDWEVAS